VFLAGLLRLWLLDEQNGLGMRRAARTLIAAHVRGRRAGALPARGDANNRLRKTDRQAA
jgi:hypothetical protein